MMEWCGSDGVVWGLGGWSGVGEGWKEAKWESREMVRDVVWG